MKRKSFNFNEDCPETTIRCDCGCGKRLVVTKYKDEDYEDYDITFQTDCTEKCLTFFERIKAMFNFIRGRTYVFSEVLLNKEDIKKLSENLLELLNK